ncbi:hypothetical protein P7C71_g5434, partial [Lecanoromycetidae sp. Uapishka_2]
MKLEYTCAVNVFTDLLIMALPFWMLKDLKIDRSQKIGLGLIFSVALVCVALDIVRTVEAVAQHQALYTIIEINLVVIMSCLPAYRALLTIFQRRKASRPKGNSAWKSLEDGVVGESVGRDNHQMRSVRSYESEPGLNGIQVTRDVDILNRQRDPYSLESLGGQSEAKVTSPFQSLSFS